MENLQKIKNRTIRAGVWWKEGKKEGRKEGKKEG
jgi:hypothetical protein